MSSQREVGGGVRVAAACAGAVLVCAGAVAACIPRCAEAVEGGPVTEGTPNRAVSSEVTVSPTTPLDPGWVRVGPLGPLPRRTSEAFPLSDQQNRGGWIRVDAMWDEFSGDRPDEQRWFLTNPWWKGRKPFAFDPANVSVRDGNLVLTASAKLDGKALESLPEGFTHSSAFVRSKASLRYGYVEVRARIAHAAVASCIFLLDSGPDYGTELDLVEMAGADPVQRRRLGLSRHVTRLPGFEATGSTHPRASVFWESPEPLDEGFHVFGLEWDREWLAWYLDGVLVHRARNTHWHFPLRVILDMEAQQPYQANPMESLLPAEFLVDFLRTWTRTVPSDGPHPTQGRVNGGP